MNTRKESANKELFVDFGDKSRQAVIQALTPVAVALGYNLEDMCFGWNINPKSQMTMILDYNIPASNPMYWHQQFTFVLQRNIGIFKPIQHPSVLF